MNRELHRSVICWGAALLALVTAASCPAGEAVAVNAGAGECVTLFTQDDPRLFDFIDTRRGVDYQQYAGKRVRHITYLTLPVFNEKDKHEDNWLYRLANSIHILTKHSVIESRMLVHEEDALEVERIRESERILRESRYLYDAMILPAQVCGDDIDLLVVVRDVWTLQVTGSFGRTGGRNSTSVGLSDNNIFGYGHSVHLSYQADANRKGVAYGFTSDHLLDGHTRLDIEHLDSGEGPSDTLLIERPFYSIDTPWSAGLSYGSDNVREKVSTGDATSNAYDHHSEVADVRIGISSGIRDNVVHHWRIGISSKRNTYNNQDPAYSATASLPEDRVIAYPWLEFESLEYDYWTTSNVNQLFRNEDINLGTIYSIRAGVTSAGLGSTDRDWVSQLNWQKTSSFGSHHVFRNQAYATLYRNIDSGELEHSYWGYSAYYDHFIDELNRWHILMQFDAGSHLSPEEMLTTGGIEKLNPGGDPVRDVHLFGFPDDIQRGDRFALLDVEHRHFFDVHPFHLFRIGSALFFEAGKVWDTKDTFEQSEATLYDVGIGLRVNSSKARPNHIIHMNLAFPLNERDTAGTFQWSVYVSETF